MSALLELLNVIKTQFTPDWLIPGQRSAAAAVADHLRAANMVNLAGPPGRGKTFCGWALARQLGATVVTDPAHLPHKAEAAGATLIVDNAPDDLRALRMLLTELQLRDVRRAVVITHHANELGLPAVIVPAPSAEDCAGIQERLARHYPFYPGPPGSDLWAWIRSAFD